jgi:hypothetical protein
LRSSLFDTEVFGYKIHFSGTATCTASKSRTLQVELWHYTDVNIVEGSLSLPTHLWDTSSPLVVLNNHC